MTPLEGIDYAWDRPTSLTALKQSGHGAFVCRYLSAGVGGSKDLTLAEARALTAARIPIVVVWETTAGRAAEGYQAGQTDARRAAAQALACGQPHDRPIVFAVDFDATVAEVVPYFKGIKSVIGWRTEAYGSYTVCKGLFDRGLIGGAWQTYAWSYIDGEWRWEPRAHLRQYSNDHIVAGCSCDLDRALFPDYGQWMIGWSPSPILYPFLRRRDRGHWVGVLARNLHFLRDPENGGKPYYGPLIPGLQYTDRAFFTGGLESAVKVFQFRHRHARTGTVDKATWHLIANAIAAQKATAH